MLYLPSNELNVLVHIFKKIPFTILNTIFVYASLQSDSLLLQESYSQCFSIVKLNVDIKSYSECCKPT